jgi:hypothetical protein
VTATEFKQALALDPSSLLTDAPNVAAWWVEQHAGGVTPLASSIPPNARIGVVYVLRD